MSNEASVKYQSFSICHSWAESKTLVGLFELSSSHQTQGLIILERHMENQIGIRFNLNINKEID